MTTRRFFLRTAALAGALLGAGAGRALGDGSAAPRTAQENAARRKAKNVIFMVADGMNTASLCAARQFQKLVLNKENVWLSLFESRSAVRSLVETSSANSIVTDSSAASSCWGSGQRVNNGVVNISVEGRPLETLYQKAKRNGKVTGLVTTATVTHATPAGFVAATRKRDDEAVIARQYLERNVDVLLGGGTKFFDKKLLSLYKEAGYALFNRRDELLASAASAYAPVLGLFSESHLPYTLNRAASVSQQAAVPTLAEMAAYALRRLSDSPAAGNGFILQIEGARVDHAGHANDAATLIHDLLAFDEAVSVVLEFVDKHPDTLLVITTDHGCGGMNINGVGSGYADSTKAFTRLSKFKRSYSQMKREVKVFNSGEFGDYLEVNTGIRLHGSALKSAARALSAARAYSADTMKDSAVALGQSSAADVFQPHTGVGWTSGNHTGDLCELAALGPGAERFTPFLRNDQIHGLLLEALGMR
jgi:alkaline phosphatase